ncbi:hypothetical protein TSUD_195670 [Trifolium subterraneum]|nr:hypothetical protein TSUD_195670 [Trifolium subterraneum]
MIIATAQCVELDEGIGLIINCKKLDDATSWVYDFKHSFKFGNHHIDITQRNLEIKNMVKS